MSDADDDADFNPFVTVTEGNLYLGLWFVPGGDRDWMCVVHKPEGAAIWQAGYRFRYYADPKEIGGFDPFDNKDTKSGWRVDFRPDHSDGEVVKIIDGMMNVIIAQGYLAAGERPWRRINKDRSYESFTKLILSAPFVHITTPEALKLGADHSSKRGRA